MKSFLFTFLFTTFSTILLSQTNLIQNGGFENNLNNWSTAEKVLVWQPNMTTCFIEPSDVNSNCASSINDRSIDPINSWFGIQQAFEGDKYVGVISNHRVNGLTLGTSEKGNLGYNLSSSLEKGKKYILKYKISKMDRSMNNPNLKIFLNDEFDDDWFDDTQVISNNKQTNDHSPSNILWDDYTVYFTAGMVGLDWIMFKVNNDFINKAAWAGVYLDDIQLYEYCDYELFNNGYNCQYSSGEIDVKAGPLSTSGPLYHWKDYPEQFHLYNLKHVTHLRMNIIPISSSTIIKTIEWNSTNGFEGLFDANHTYNEIKLAWDGKNSIGTEVEIGTYIADVEAWNDADCSHQHKTFSFVKINGFNEPTEDLFEGFYSYEHWSDIIWNSPINFKPCCSSDITINNSHFSQYDFSGNGHLGLYVYESKKGIIFGPDVSTDINTKITLKAPEIINLTSPLQIKGEMHAFLRDCPPERVKNPISNLLIENDIISNKINFSNLYPNPSFDGEFNLSVDSILNLNNFQLNIYNSVGLAIKFYYKILDTNIKINLYNNSKGIYFVRLISDKIIKQGKIIIN